MAAIEIGSSQFSNGSYSTDTNWTTITTVSSTNFTAGNTYIIGVDFGIGGDNISSPDFHYRVAHGATPTSFTTSEVTDFVPHTASSTQGAFIYTWFVQYTMPGGGAEDILIQGKTDNAANALEWVGGHVWWIGLDGLTSGTDYRYATDSSGLTAHNTTLTARITETWTPENNNDDWLVMWWCQFEGRSTTISAECELSDGTTATLLRREFDDTATGTDKGLMLGSKRVYTLPNTSTTLTIKSRDDASGTQNQYFRSGLFALRLNAFEDHWNHEPGGSLTATDTTTWYTTTQPTITFTPQTAGDIFIVPYSRWDRNGTNVSYMRLNRATDNFTYLSGSGEGSGRGATETDDLHGETWATVMNLTATSHTIGVEFRSPFGGASIWDLRGITAFSAELGIALTQEYPDADVAATGWDTQPTASQSLYVQVDETTPSDTDYIHPT